MERNQRNRSLSQRDRKQRGHIFHEGFLTSIDRTVDVTLMVGQTGEVAEIDHLGDDFTFIGSRHTREIRFYAPTRDVIFAPENLTATIDGGDRSIRTSGISPVYHDAQVFILLI